jgi:hypothetical protein
VIPSGGTEWIDITFLKGKKVLIKTNTIANGLFPIYDDSTPLNVGLYNTWLYYDFSNVVALYNLLLFADVRTGNTIMYYIDDEKYVNQFITNKLLEVQIQGSDVLIPGRFYLSSDKTKLFLRTFENVDAEIFPNLYSNITTVMPIDDSFIPSWNGELYKWYQNNSCYLRYLTEDDYKLLETEIGTQSYIIPTGIQSVTLNVDIPSGAYTIDAEFDGNCFFGADFKDANGNTLAGNLYGPDAESRKTIPVGEMYSTTDPLHKEVYFNSSVRSITTSNPNGANVTLNIKRKKDNQEYDLIVAGDGSGHLTSLFDAICWVGDTQQDHKTIFVKPGNYEMPKCNFNTGVYRQNRNISIIGSDKNSVIIFTNDGFYDSSVGDTAPLQLAGKVTIKNVTIKSLSTNPSSETNIASYCIHSDYNCDPNSIMLIENCILYNDHCACVGIGLRPSYTIVIRNCELKTTWALQDPWSGAVICHSGGSGSGQNIKIEDCVVESAGQAFSLVGNDDEVVGTFIRNAVFTESGYNVIALEGNAGARISEMSCLNNKSELNYSV